MIIEVLLNENVLLLNFKEQFLLNSKLKVQECDATEAL
jgi:hypothetical protein